MKEVLNRLQKFPNNLDPISSQVKRYLDNNTKYSDEEVKVLHRPWVAPLNWGLMLYQGANPEWFQEFQKRTMKEIPEFYLEFLKHINGCFLFDMSLYGLTPSVYETGSLNRTILQCHDLTTANNSWVYEYDVDPKLFHFGSRHYTEDENVGYFFADEQILCFRNNGEQINQWKNLESMLFEEIEVVEQMMLENVPNDVKLVVK